MTNGSVLFSDHGTFYRQRRIFLAIVFCLLSMQMDC